MKTKILGIFIIGVFTLSGIGINAEPIYSINNNMQWEQIENISRTSRYDELDQTQTEMDFFAPVGNIFLAPEINYITAQSFIPTKNILTRIEIKAGKNSSADYDYTLAVRDNLSKPGGVGILSNDTQAFILFGSLVIKLCFILIYLLILLLSVCFTN